jgi:hypothetical protein
MPGIKTEKEPFQAPFLFHTLPVYTEKRTTDKALERRHEDEVRFFSIGIVDV